MKRLTLIIAICLLGGFATRLGQASVVHYEAHFFSAHSAGQLSQIGADDMSEAAANAKKKKKKKKKKGGTSNNVLIGGDLILEDNNCLDRDPPVVFTVSLNFRVIDGSATVSVNNLATFDALGTSAAFTAQGLSSSGGTITIEATKLGTSKVYQIDYEVAFPTGGSNGACFYTFKGTLNKL